MALSIFLGRVLGLYLIIVGFFYLFRRALIQKIAVQIFENEAFIIITAIISLIIGLLIVVGHNVWEWKWTLIVTLLGYLSLIKGLTRLFIPSRTDKKMIMKALAKNNPIYIGLFCLIIGFLLTYEGFFGAI
jgi:hypothetical protein